jgi:membrane-associated phospholipid phosphatase
MSETLLSLDYKWFLAINELDFPTWLEKLLIFWRTQESWYFLYAVLIFLIFRNFKSKTWIVLIGLGLTVTFCDQSSAKWIKPTFGRLRPCRTEVLLESVNARVECGSGLSFPSSHATNHLGVASFLVFLTAGKWNKSRHLLWPWAILVGFAQIYVGLHFPSDVLFGSLLGFTWGGLFSTLVLWFLRNK